MTTVKFQDATINVNDGEPVLDALLRNGFDIPHGCRAGACQSCIMKATSGTLPAQAQKGLKESQKALSLFLSCSCIPQTDLEVCEIDAALPKHKSKVLSVSQVKPNILQIKLTKPFDFKAGQFINIWLDDHHLRSYSIASLPEDNFIELHVKVIPDGKFSAWAAAELKQDDELLIQGPLGECFYLPTDSTQPLLLAGIGTGLAPLIGIVKDALAHNHAGKIRLYLGAREANGFYLEEELQNLATNNPQFSINWIAQNGANNHVIEGDIYQYIKQEHPSTKGFRVFLCGAESFVKKMKKQCFLAGANMKEIHADAFLPSVD